MPSYAEQMYTIHVALSPQYLSAYFGHLCRLERTAIVSCLERTAELKLDSAGNALLGK
jgi:hypothetical protein